MYYEYGILLNNHNIGEIHSDLGGAIKLDSNNMEYNGNLGAYFYENCEYKESLKSLEIACKSLHTKTGRYYHLWLGFSK